MRTIECNQRNKRLLQSTTSIGIHIYTVWNHAPRGLPEHVREPQIALWATCKQFFRVHCPKKKTNGRSLHSPRFVVLSASPAVFLLLWSHRFGASGTVSGLCGRLLNSLFVFIFKKRLRMGGPCFLASPRPRWGARNRCCGLLGLAGALEMAVRAPSASLGFWLFGGGGVARPP